MMVMKIGSALTAPIIQMKFALPQAKKFGGVGNLFFYRQRPGALLDRARAEGDNLGARGIME